ncbi:MAG: hypothetical protein IJZ30_07205 [Alphaproteobacteria bacterium]|nr:hypothetical protein [Alphaproteobacteria bacterium]
MEKELGFIDNEEQFLDVDEEICPIDDNIKAFEFFESVGFEDDIVIAPCSIGFVNDKEDEFLLFWIAIDKTNKRNPAIVSAFNIDDKSIFKELDACKIKCISSDCYFVWNSELYYLVYTKTGNVAIKKVNGLWTESEMNMFMSLKEPDIFHPQIYPVELFSKSKHQFITAVWAIEDNCNEKFIWFPICWDDFSLWKKFPASDIDMFPLNIGDVTRAGNIVFEVKYNKDIGFHVEKTSKPLSDYHLAKDLRNLEKPKKAHRNIDFSPKIEEISCISKDGKSRVIQLFPEAD